MNKLQWTFVILIILNLSLSAESVRSLIHQNGFCALVDDASAAQNNPAGLYFIRRPYMDMQITSSEFYHYETITGAVFLGRKNLFSSKYPSSINMGFSVTRSEIDREYRLAGGGTLINRLKYGATVHYHHFPASNTDDWNLDGGLIWLINNYFTSGIWVRNMMDKSVLPTELDAALAVSLRRRYKISLGTRWDGLFKRTPDFSVSVEAPVSQRVVLLGAYQKTIIPIGCGLKLYAENFKFSPRDRNNYRIYRLQLWMSLSYHRELKKIDRFMITCQIMLPNPASPPHYPPKIRTVERTKIVYKEAPVVEEEIVEPVRNEKNVADSLNILLEQQVEFLERAKIYFGELMFDAARKELRSLIKLNETSTYAEKARAMLKEINKIEPGNK